MEGFRTHSLPGPTSTSPRGCTSGELVRKQVRDARNRLRVRPMSLPSRWASRLGQANMMNPIPNWACARRAATLGMGAMSIAMLSGCLLEELAGDDPETRSSAVRGGCALLDDQEPNDTSAQSTPLALDSVIAGCLDRDDEEDHFQFRAPPQPVSGGFVTLEFSNVDPDLKLWVLASVASNNLELDRIQAVNRGAPLTIYWAVDPNADYRFSVRAFGGAPAGSIYTLEAIWTPIVDPFEPNQDRNSATPLAVNTTTEAYFSAGVFETSNKTAPAADWYSVELQSGPARFEVTNPPSDIKTHLHLFDSRGVELFGVTADNEGAELGVSRTLKEPGTYYVQVEPFTGPYGYRGGTDRIVPAHLVQTYALTVSQP
jgi:hypothetical protein